MRHPSCPRRWSHWPLSLLLSCAFIACNAGPDAIPVDRQSGTAESAPQPPTATATSSPAASPSPTLMATLDPTSTSIPPPTATVTATLLPSPTPTSTPVDNSAPVIVLDPGHDRTTPGALGVEYQDVLKSAMFTKAALEAAGYRVYLTRTDNDTVFVDDTALLPPNAADFHPGYSHAYAHASKALQFDPDMVIVLHFNGHPDSDVSRLEIYYCDMGGPQNLVLAEIMRDELLVALRSLGYEPSSTQVTEDIAVARGNRHFPSLGNVYDFPTTWLHNRYAGIPVVLTEPLYETNAAGRALIQDDATHLALALAYVRAVDRYFGR